MDSNGSGEAAGQQQSSSSGSDPMATTFGVGRAEGEEEWQLKEDLMGAFEGALDVGGKRGDLRGIRVLKNDRVMGARDGGGPCFGNCEDDDGAEWVGGSASLLHKVTKRPVIWVKLEHVQPNGMTFVVIHQITFQVKRVRKAKVDGTDSAASSDDSQNGESLSGGHSVLEISGPTIPSPGPSGSCLFSLHQHEHRKKH